MQRPLDFQRRSDGELIKEGGFQIDLDEIARRGSMSKEEKFIGKWYGLYDQRQAGNFMARVVLPGGVLPSAQARALATVAERHALGLVSFTTREAAQLHWLKLKMLPEIMRELQHAGLSTHHGCGDVTRNVTACPWADVCEHRRLDSLVDTHHTAVTLSGMRDLDDLPRKFKINFNGCGAGCGLPWMNDVGLMGALAIIRFRNMLKDTRDIAFVFCALAIGMACGSMRYSVAILGTVVLSSITFYLHRFSFGSHEPHNAFLRVRTAGPVGEGTEVLDILGKFCRQWVLAAATEPGEGQAEYTFHLQLHDMRRNPEMLGALQEIEMIKDLDLTLQEQLLEI